MKNLLCILCIAVIFLPQYSFSQGRTISDSAKAVVELRINSINEKIKEKNYDWNAGITSLSYLSKEEMSKLCGLHLDTLDLKDLLQKEDSLRQEYNRLKKTGTETIMSVPIWLNMMSWIEEQECGNCWAYAAAGVATGLLHNYNSSNIGIDLYEMDITNHASCGDCDGTNWLPCGLDYIYNYKVSAETGLNQFPNYDHAYYKVSSYSNNTASISAIKSSLQLSPVLAGMAVYQDFQDYSGGIYQHTYGGYLDGHAVVILGYDDVNQCWICRNSWGTGWGEIPPGGGPHNERGYFRIKYSQCGIDTYGNVTGTISSQNCYAKIIPNLISSVNTAFSYGFVSNEWAYVLGSTTLSGDVSVPSGVTLLLKSGSTLNFTGSYKINVSGALNNQGIAGQLVIINGQNYSRTGYSNSIIDIKDGASVNINYTNFINSAYDLFIRNSTQATVTNSNFSNFGVDANSRAVTVACSTGTVTINNCTFTGSGQNGIGIYSNDTGTNVTISNNTFTSCRYGIRCYSSNAFLTSNTIQNSYYYGIYSDNVAMNADYRDNTISGNPASYGIYLNNSSPYLMYNTITSNKVFINSGTPSFARRVSEDPTQRGYNTVSNASAPLIRIQNYSSPYMGYDYGGGYNSIFETDYPHIYATNHCAVNADNNYWGEEGPINTADGTSWINDDRILDYNPNLGKKSVLEAGENLVDQSFLEDQTEFIAAIDTGFNSDYVKAKEILNTLIYKQTTSKYPVLSILMYDFFTKRELQDEKSNRAKNTVENELITLLSDLSTKSIDDPLRPF